MLTLLQIALALYFIVLLVQVIGDFFKGSFLILTGLLLLMVAYMLKLIAWLLRLCQRKHHPRPPGRTCVWKVVHE